MGCAVAHTHLGAKTHLTFADKMVFPAIRTDLVEVTHELDAPCRFLYKKETQQPSGSFKLRGMSKLIDQNIREAGAGSVEVYTSSGGNAGLAAAYASKQHGVPCTVVLPMTAKKAALDKLEALGATVHVHGAHWGEADSYLKNTIIPAAGPQTRAVYCHPFDDKVLHEGHADMVDEIAEQLESLNVKASKIKGVVCSCGGGGLYNGVVTGLRRHKALENVPVLVIETNQTPTLAETVKADKLIVLSKIDTLSTSLAAPFVAASTFDNYKSHPSTIALVDDLDAVRATVDHYDTFGEIIEPACGATVAISTHYRSLLDSFGALAPEDVVIFIVCGGATVSPETLQQYREILEEKGILGKEGK